MPDYAGGSVNKWTVCWQLSNQHQELSKTLSSTSMHRAAETCAMLQVALPCHQIWRQAICLLRGRFVRVRREEVLVIGLLCE